MKNPPHPGGIVKDCLDDLGLSVTEAAKVLGVARPTLSRIINGRSAISPEMALRLSLAFGSTPEMWLRLQTAYDLAQARQRFDTSQIQPYSVPELPSKQAA
jgi:addiction module HigA family antidote